MRLRDLQAGDIDHFGIIGDPPRYALFVFLRTGQVAHVGNSIDQPFEFPSIDQALEFSRHYFPQIAVELSKYTVPQLQAMLAMGGVSHG